MPFELETERLVLREWEARDRGLATEAARALHAHGFRRHGLERIVAITHPRNLKSRR